MVADDRIPDDELSAERVAVLAELSRRDSRVAPSLKPLTLNTQQPLREPPGGLGAKLVARTESGFSLEGHDYPRSRNISRIVVPATTMAGLDLVLFAGSAIAAAFHVHLAWLLATLSLIAFLGLGAIAVVAGVNAMRDPLRLTDAERRTLNLSRSWQSSQPWMGPLAASAEHGLVELARDTVARLAASTAWASRYLDEHRLRLDLMSELDGIDQHANQLAQLRTRAGAGNPSEHDPQLNAAWDGLVDRVARLRVYANGVIALDHQVTHAQLAAHTAQLDSQLGQLAAGSAMDQFATEHVRALTTELQHLAASNAITNDAASHRNAT
jgi:hypothetical protein